VFFEEHLGKLGYGGVLGPPDACYVEIPAAAGTTAAARSEDAHDDKQEEIPESRSHKLT
jgi:hypothetical protein